MASCALLYCKSRYGKSSGPNFSLFSKGKKMPHISTDQENPKVDKNVFTITKGYEERVYTYDEAIDLAGGSGRYSIGLLLSLGMSTIGMIIEMYGFSIIVNSATCELGLDVNKTSILLSVCFIGPILTGYFWGYYSDTYGRRRSILVYLWVSYLFSTLSAFSPNWVVLAVIKFISTSFCSSISSISSTLLGECCACTIRDGYIMIVSSFINWGMVVYVVIAYFILNLDFSYHLVYITFTPWRLLSIILALPLGIGAVCVHCFYESPKFLINAGRDKEALDYLTRMWKRNNNKGEYPVQKVVLMEEGNISSKGVPLLRSLWDQIVPIFKPPLLWKSLQIYFSTFVVYSTNCGFSVWFPFLVEKFSAGLSSLNTNEKRLCKILLSQNNVTAATKECKSSVDIALIWSSLGEGCLLTFLLLTLSRIFYRKKLIQIGILFISGLAAILVALVKDYLTSAIMYVGILSNELCAGILFSYYVDLFPTSYRGMASCIGTLVGRVGALAGVNTIGAFVLTFCDEVFYFTGFLLFCSVAVSLLLPPDKKPGKLSS